ncbi:glycoside hydrolase family 19 protein [Rhodococcus sp. ARC_M6]|uniref:glycoside hydrolase family 19 protein n=1 Tax=Rhodococcus sp. ARC_M6 TaxID=2928852 RepID=UPI0027E024A2|nr:glycoside hydrolase family 19 protein [Rhodococcus sp. ARC_M6]
MDAQTLAKVMGNRVSPARYEELCPAFNAAMVQAGCTSERRATMWCAQIGHESGGLQWMEEIASGEKYEWRTDLGNTQPGDGVRFKGRGPIQITGRYNYGKVSAWAHSEGYVPTPTYFVDNPTELSNPTYGFLGAVWYWTVARNMNGFADNDDLLGATRAVNGGTHGLDDRRAFWYRAGDAGAAILPKILSVGGAQMGVPELVQDQLVGVEGRGWPFLGKSKQDPLRDNTLPEAVGETLKLLTTPQPSLINPEVSFDAVTYLRLVDAAAYRTEKAVEKLTEQVALLVKTVGGK